MKITQIVPTLPPEINGLGDYASILACGLRRRYAVDTDFIVTDRCKLDMSSCEGFAVRKTHCSVEDLSSILRNSSEVVLLHYVSYAYSARGCPYWLLSGLRNWKHGRSGARLVTIFHEIYAKGPVWRSEFWTSPLQKYLARCLARLSDTCVTSNQLFAGIISRLDTKSISRISYLPVFSNVGELAEVLPLVKRKPNLIVFGSGPNHLGAYSKSLTSLRDIYKRLNIKRVLNIGRKDVKLPHIEGVLTEELGVLSASQISSLMSESTAGFLDYSPDFLGKSGIFAAYCAHGLFPINSSASRNAYDGLREREHYWPVGISIRPDLVKAQAIADNCYRWYQGHNIAAHSELFSKILRGQSI